MKKLSEVRKDVSKALLTSDSIKTRLDPPFKFKSGTKSPVYVDCRRLISLPEIRKDVCDALAKIAKEEIGLENFDVVAGGVTAGVPYAMGVAERLNMPLIYIRPEPKKHGKGTQVEGILKDGDKVLLIEDLITSGHSKLLFRDAINNHEADASMPHCLSVFEYFSEEHGLREGRDNMAKNKINLFSIANWDSVFKAAEDLGHPLAENKDIVVDFLKDPRGWAKRHGYETE